VPKRVDHRTRRDRIIRREHAFDLQLDALVEAYLNWSVEQKDRHNRLRSGRGFCVGMEPALNVPADAGSVHVKVVDVFGKGKLATMFPPNFTLLVQRLLPYP